MTVGIVLLVTVVIGVVSGLRAFTGVAAVAWAAHLGWIHLGGSPLSFIGAAWAVGLFTILALVEYVTDQLPKTPSRTVPMQLGARLLFGILAGACLAIAGTASVVVGIVCAVVGVLIGTFGGHRARVGLVKSLNVRDIVIAIPEDLIAIGLAFWAVSRF
jgi:uncharacterized membrane protein